MDNRIGRNNGVDDPRGSKGDGRDQHADGGHGAEAHDHMVANKPNKASTIVKRENTTVEMRDVAIRRGGLRHNPRYSNATAYIDAMAGRAG
jgi:hypothetical protein